MLMNRFWVAISILAIAGSLSQKKVISTHAGTLVTYSPVFIFLLASVVIIIGSLSFLPVLALGPIVEYIKLVGLG